MKLRVLTAFLFLAAPFLCPAQRKEYVMLQRDIAILQDQVRTLQRALDERTAQLTLLIQQTLDAINKANTSMVALENDLRERLREQEKNVARPVATTSAKVDQLASEFQALRETVADLNVRFGRLELQLVDMVSAVRTLQAPPAPPGGVAPPQGMSAESLYQNALRDKSGGSLDLALKGFADYLQFFGNTELAPNAQYYIGEIHYQKGELEEAVKAFDLVLEKFQESNKTPDAHFMKGMALVRMGQRNKGRDEFYTLIRRFPSHELAAKAKSQLRALGLPATPPKR